MLCCLKGLYWFTSHPHLNLLLKRCLIFMCVPVTALCWWLTASPSSNSSSACSICPWVAAITFTSPLSRKLPSRRHLSEWLDFKSPKLTLCLLFPVTWVRCFPCCACWMCLASYTTATCPLWRRRCLTSPSTPGLSPTSPGPRPPAGSSAASVTGPCGTGSVSWGSNCNHGNSCF